MKTDIMRTTEIETKAALVRQVFSQIGLKPVDVPILQPADPFLDSVGEDLRRRIFMTENENGDSLCLRPEFTIPVCLKHIAENHATPHRYSYIGEVFRQKRLGMGSFIQAGIEDLGEANEAEADARSLHDAFTIVKRVSSLEIEKIIIGDQALFAAVLNALGLPHGWQKKLMRCFGNDQLLQNLLHDFAKPTKPLQLPDYIAQKIANRDSNGLEAVLEGEMLTANISLAFSRSPQEIARRLMEKAELAQIQLDQKSIIALQEFLNIDVSLDRAADILENFAHKNKLHLGKEIEHFSARTKALLKVGFDIKALHYDAAFGRPLDYYTSLVYEIRANNGKVMVGGGRYNRLLTMLGAKQMIPAVGFSMWLDRMGGDA